jgi:APA family basic amino acid/polyamine antiporter
MNATSLKRSLSLPLVVLYGLGVTIGAGIYVLLGAAAGEAGTHAPMAFLLAAVVMIFSAASFAEMAGRYPVSAGEAAYVEAGFKRRWLSLVVGLMVISSGVVSSAAITVGSTGYIQEFVAFDRSMMIVAIVIVVAGVAAWGILESVLFASFFTVIEAGALMTIIGAGLVNWPSDPAAVPSFVPDMTDIDAWAGVAGAGLLAFFAFIGFEDMVNLAEEVKQPRRTLPWAILITLVLATFLYFLVAVIAVTAVPVDELAASEAPVTLVFDRITGLSPTAITAIAIVATLNGVIIQFIMASRVLYGLGDRGALPSVFARVNPVTRTPLVATATITGIVLILALFLPLQDLAEWTSRIVLTIFTLVNFSLILLKSRADAPPSTGFLVPIWVPVCGVATCVALLVADMIA